MRCRVTRKRLAEIEQETVAAKERGKHLTKTPETMPTFQSAIGSDAQKLIYSTENRTNLAAYKPGLER